MAFRTRLLQWTVVLLFLAFGLSNAIAQNAQVSGIVADSQKAVISNATIEISPTFRPSLADCAAGV